MKLEILQVFVEAVEQGSFSKAGEKLYLSQPTVSRYISDLEKQVNGTLFLRNAHTCEPTLLGRQVYVHARRIVNEWESIAHMSVCETYKQNTLLRIGYSYSDVLKLITLALAKSNPSSEKVELSVRFGTGRDITRFILEEKLDCAVMHLPSVTCQSGLSIRLICKCNMCMHASTNHRLATHKTLKLEQLIHEKEVRVSSEPEFNKQIDEAFIRLGLPSPEYTTVHAAMDCLPSISYKNHIAFCADIFSSWPGCVKVPIQDWTTDFSLVFVTREGYVSDSAEKLYNTLCMDLKR